MIKAIVVIISTANTRRCFLSVRHCPKNFTYTQGQPSQQTCEGVIITTAFHSGETRAQRSEITQPRSHSSQGTETWFKLEPYRFTDSVPNHYPILLSMLIMEDLETWKHTSKDKLPTVLHPGNKYSTLTSSLFSIHRYKNTYFKI